MRKVINPYVKLDNKEYKCFGCSPFNEVGLQLEFFEDGEEIVAIWEPRKHLEGYFNTLHGGIQATLLDEIASWVVWVKGGTAGVTSNMDIRYKNPVLINEGPITLRARLVEPSRRLAKIETTLFRPDGKVGSEATVTYFLFPEKVAREKFHYPGVESFFEEEKE